MGSLVCGGASVTVRSHWVSASLLLDRWRFNLFEVDALSILDDELLNGDRRLLRNPSRVVAKLIHLVVMCTTFHTNLILGQVLPRFYKTLIIRFEMGLAAKSMLRVVVLCHKLRLKRAVIVQLVLLLLLPRLLDIPLLLVIHLYTPFVKTRTRILNLLKLVVVPILTKSGGALQPATGGHHLGGLLLALRYVSMVNEPSTRDVRNVLARQLIILSLKQLPTRSIPSNLLRFRPTSLPRL